MENEWRTERNGLTLLMKTELYTDTTASRMIITTSALLAQFNTAL